LDRQLMTTERISTAALNAIERALAVLGAGGLVVMPTDTVYGVGCLAFNSEAVARLYLVKGRPDDKPIPVLLGSADELDRVVIEVPQPMRHLAQTFWPGPLTLILPRHPSLPQAIGPGATVGVRVPAHRLAQRLLSAAGPMAVTSANLSGEPPARSAGEAETALAGRVDLILDDGPSPGGQPSTVVDGTTDPVTILRHGPISEADLIQSMS
jgi:tRNA threonylcarbamoyl adenosine modification protein (Sua5/YciO/YrdC/YwlC family)